MDKLEELNKQYKQVVSKPSLDNLNKVSNRSSVSSSREGNNDPLVSLPATARSSAVDTDEVVVEREQDNLPTGVVQVFINGQTNPDGTPKATCWTNFQKVGGGYASSVNAVLDNNKSFDTCQECLEDLIPPPPPEPVIDGIVRTFDGVTPWTLDFFPENTIPNTSIGPGAFKITGTLPGSTISNPIEVDSVTVSTTGPPSVSDPNADIYNCFTVTDDPNNANSYIMRLANGKRQAYVSKQNDLQGPSGGAYDITMTVTRGTQVVTFNIPIEIRNIFDDEDNEIPGIYVSTGGFTNRVPNTTTLNKRAVFPWQGTDYSGTGALGSSSGFLNLNPSNTSSSFIINSTARMNVWGSTAWDAARPDNLSFIAQISRSYNGNNDPQANWDGGYRDASGPLPSSRVDGLSYAIHSLYMKTCLVDISPNNANQGELTSFNVFDIGGNDGDNNFADYRPVASDFEIVTAGDTSGLGVFIRYKINSRLFGNGQGSKGCLSWSDGLYGNGGTKRAAVWMKFNIKVTDASRYDDGTGATPTGTSGPGSYSTTGFYVNALVYKGDNDTN